MRGYPIEEFLWGFGAGVVALVVAAALASATRLRPRGSDGCHRGERRLWSRAWRTPGRPAGGPVTGLLTAAAALGCISRTWPVNADVLLGLGGVAVAATCSGRRLSAARTPSDRWPLVGGVPLAVPALVATPFAWLLAIDASSTGWVRGLVVASVVLGALTVPRTDAEWGHRGIPPGLYAIAAAGVFAAVPDTEEVATLLGASIPAALAAWPLGHGRLGTAGGGTATALLVWVAAVGGRGRQSSIVGAIACLGLLVTLPAGRWLASSTRRGGRAPPPECAPGLLLVAQAVVVAVASRVGGVSGSLQVAVLGPAVAVIAALVVSMLVRPRGESLSNP